LNSRWLKIYQTSFCIVTIQLRCVNSTIWRSKNQKLGKNFVDLRARIKSWISGSLICWSEGERIRSLTGTCLDLFFLPKKKKRTQVSVLRNSRRWGIMGHHSCTGRKGLWKFCLESKEIRRYEGSWFIDLAMVERNYERA
jgi:hypothetical protein